MCQLICSNFGTICSILNIGLNRLEFNFLLIKHTVSIKLSERRRDQLDEITEIAFYWYYQQVGIYGINHDNAGLNWAN